MSRVCFKKGKGILGLFGTQSNIYDEAFRENSYQLKTWLQAFARVLN